MSELERKARAFDVLVDRRWVVGRDPRHRTHPNRFVCSDPTAPWPSCVSGEGNSPVEAVEAALQREQEQAAKEITDGQ